MCGIAGLLGRFSTATISAMVKTLAHRGPDDEGAWRDMDAGVQLGHRRLSIIDVSDAAAQPMLSADGRYVTIFNGEIYNYKALVAFLHAKAVHAFNPRSDTAVLAPLFALEGPAMLDRLEGMFAFAIWDRHARRLFLARDHAGVKPLYLAETPAGLAFASELKAFRSVVDDWTIDPVAMAEYLTFLYTPSERTVLKAARKLRPGHLVMARRVERSIEVTVERWYRPPLPRDRSASASIGTRSAGHFAYDYAKRPEHLLRLFDEVVAEQCTSDVPVGAFLSGGVDSSAVVASMVATGHRPAATYCIGFDGTGMRGEGFEDDLSFAKQVASHLDVPFTPLMIEPDSLLDRLPGLAMILDEPTPDAAPLLVQDIAARARADGIKVLLGGTGGDDLFSGYRR
jgi:asparagine synthase (glutamine-hydrolysing)